MRYGTLHAMQQFSISHLTPPLGIHQKHVIKMVVATRTLSIVHMPEKQNKISPWACIELFTCVWQSLSLHARNWMQFIWIHWLYHGVLHEQFKKIAKFSNMLNIWTPFANKRLNSLYVFVCIWFNSLWLSTCTRIMRFRQFRAQM